MAMEGKVQLKSSDDVMFEVDESVTFESEKITQMILDAGKESIISLPAVHSSILQKVITYCAYHVEAAKNDFIPKEDVEKWDEEFAEVDVYIRFHLCKAADDLKIKNLIELMCSTIADMLRGKTEEETRAILHM